MSPSILVIFQGLSQVFFPQGRKQYNKKIYKNVWNQIVIATRTKAGNVVVDLASNEMIQCEYSRNIVQVTYIYVCSHNEQSRCVGLRNAVGSAPDCKSRGGEFGPQPRHITFKEID